MLLRVSRTARLRTVSARLLVSAHPTNTVSPIRHASTQIPAAPKDQRAQHKQDESPQNAEQKPKRKTVAELDEELRLKLEGISGDGGAAGLELEDGKPVAMKRGVKNNMFRLI
ncbi:MAG: hypothetical protein M1830_001937 [Pleopsidium flavum]|nr:MAG: hypothetical protein M1830_001937 [Pleopsidium flavum]